MSIKAYIGLQGHGKTYEVCSVVIFEAIKQGRRVISNIAGLNEAEFHKLILEESPDAQNLGRIINIAHEAVLNPDFWLTETTIDNERNDYQIQRGDLVVLDEIWRFWDGFARADGDGRKRPDTVMNFFRMHRHMTHRVTGLTCALALISQDVMDFHRSLRGVIEETYRMTQLVSVGMMNRYRIDVFAKTKVAKVSSISYQRSYNPKYFPLYKSHSFKKEGDADAKQVNIDKRGNILNGKIFTLIVPFVLILGFFAVRFVWGFLHPEAKQKTPEIAGATTETNPVTQQPMQPTASTPTQRYLHGYYKLGDKIIYLVANPNGSTQKISQPDSVKQGDGIELTNQNVTYTSYGERPAAAQTTQLIQSRP